MNRNKEIHLKLLNAAHDFLESIGFTTLQTSSTVFSPFHHVALVHKPILVRYHDGNEPRHGILTSGDSMIIRTSTIFRPLTWLTTYLKEKDIRGGVFYQIAWEQDKELLYIREYRVSDVPYDESLNNVFYIAEKYIKVRGIITLGSKELPLLKIHRKEM